MGRLIKRFSDGSELEYDKGKFDDWCVYLTRPGVPKYAPTDIQYFADLCKYADKYTSVKIYTDLAKIYNLTNKSLTNEVLSLIEQMSKIYNDDILEIEILYTILYAGMIAEENKKFAPNGKRVKRLGIHQILFEHIPPEEAANFSKKKKASWISAECKKRGF